MKTVEKSLISGIVKAGFLRKENADSLSKFGFKRASRTDRGVHAAMSSVSMKFEIKVDHLKNGFSEEDLEIGKIRLKKFIDYDLIRERLGEEFDRNEMRIYGKKKIKLFRCHSCFEEFWAETCD